MAGTEPGAVLVPIMDLGDRGDIHPRNKRPVAERLVLAALRHGYGKTETVSEPPRRTKYTPVSGGIRIRFDRAVELRGGDFSAFQIAEGEGAFKTAREARAVSPTEIEVASASGNPHAVRYAWKNAPHAALFGPEGLAVAPFRSDSRRLPSEGKY